MTDVWIGIDMMSSHSFLSAMNWSRTMSLLILLQSSRMELTSRFIVYMMSLLQWCQPLLTVHRMLSSRMLKLQTLRLDQFGSEREVGQTVCISKHLENKFPWLCHFKIMYSKVCHKSSNLEREFTGDLKMQKSSHFLFTDTSQ